jgi:hypothetical protein
MGLLMGMSANGGDMDGFGRTGERRFSSIDNGVPTFWGFRFSQLRLLGVCNDTDESQARRFRDSRRMGGGAKQVTEVVANFTSLPSSFNEAGSLIDPLENNMVAVVVAL